MVAKRLRCLWSLLAVGLIAAKLACGQDATGSADADPSVGEPRFIEQLFLPGSLLQAKPIQDQDQAIVLRIVQSFPHGTAGHRYDLVYTGYEPGSFDLRDFLQRVDGGSTADLPPIPVHIQSVLPPGHAIPHQLEEASLPRWGGYQFWTIVGIVAWVAVLWVLLLAGRRKAAASTQAIAGPTLADLLRPKLQAAVAGTLDARQFAELERMLVAMWQRRLRLTDAPPNELISKIRQHPEAGPLMVNLERWMHDPAARDSAALPQLLAPLAQISASEFDRTATADDASGRDSHHEARAV